MKHLNPAQIAHDVNLFIARTGHGSVTKLAEKSGLTPESVRKVRQETPVMRDTLLRIAEALEDLGWYKSETPQAPSANEHPENYGQPYHPPAAAIIASELRSLAAVLDSADFTPDQKAEKFVAQIRLFHRALETYRALIEKTK